MKQSLMTLCLACLTGVLACATLSGQGEPPPGGGGRPTKLSDLGCGPGEMARVNADDEWECSSDVTAIEVETIPTLESQVSVNEVAITTLIDDVVANETNIMTLDGRVGTNE